MALRNTRSKASSKPLSLLPWLPVLVAVVHSVPQVDMNYGAAYYLYGYRHGFVKRGFFGQLFSGFSRISRGEVRLVEALILAAAVAITYWAFRRLLFLEPDIAPLAVMMLCGPSILPHFFQMFIPTDPLLYIIMVACAALYLRTRVSVAWVCSLVLCGVALLVHEGFAVRGYPLIIAILLECWRRRKLPLYAVLAHVATMFLIFGAIVHLSRPDATPEVYMAEAVSRAGYMVDPQVFVQTQQTAWEGHRQSMDFVLNRGTLMSFGLSFLLSLPYIAGVFVILQRAMRADKIPAWQLVSTLLLFLSPLLLIPLTTDWFRWISDGVVCSSLFVFYLCLAAPKDAPVLKEMRSLGRSPATTFLIGYACAIGPFAGMWLSASNTIMHGYFDRFPPQAIYHAHPKLP